MYHIVYLTTNLVNQKMYVGKHSTYNLNDGYLGSGCGLKRAIKKYGKHNFKRDILHFCLTEQDAYEMESIIVDNNFIKDHKTYNNVIGGIYNKDGRLYCNESKVKLSETRKRLGIAKGQLNPASSTNMSKEQRVSKNIKTAETRKKNGSYLVSDITKKKLSLIKKGKNIKGKNFILTSPTGEYFIINNLKLFCDKYSLSRILLYKFLNKGKIYIKNNIKTEKTLNTIGWEITRS